LSREKEKIEKIDISKLMELQASQLRYFAAILQFIIVLLPGLLAVSQLGYMGIAISTLIGAIIALITIMASGGLQIGGNSTPTVRLNWTYILARYLLALEGFIFNRFKLSRGDTSFYMLDKHYINSYYMLLISARYVGLAQFAEWLEKEMNPQALSQKLKQLIRELQGEKNEQKED